MAVVNVSLNNMINVKDSRWLQLEVCREFQRSKCSRSDTECKFAHPPPNVEVQNGRVIACYDSIKGRCNREKPPCKYFHPPQHLKDQLLINGRNHLALKNALMLQMGMSPGQAVLPGQIPTIASPYLTSVPQLSGAYSPYMSASPMLQVVTSDAGVTSQLGVVSAGYPAQAAKMQRSDRIEVCREFQRGTCRRSENECRYAHPPEGVGIEMSASPLAGSGGGGGGGGGEGLTASLAATSACCDPVATVTVCMDAVRGRCSREPCRYFHPPAHLLPAIHANQQRPRNAALPSSTTAACAATAAATSYSADAGRKRHRDPAEELVMAYPGMLQYKRSAGDKTAMMYQQSAGASAAAAAAAYQQHALMQLQQPFVPVSFTHGHPPGMPRF